MEPKELAAEIVRLWWEEHDRREDAKIEAEIKRAEARWKDIVEWSGYSSRPTAPPPPEPKRWWQI